MGTFGDPSFGTPIAENENPAANQAASQEAAEKEIDINDPRLTSEELNVNVEADAYASPAPPPDADYRAKLKHLRPKNAKGEEVDALAKNWGKNPPQLVLVTGLEASIIDPSGKYDGLKAFDFNVSTFIGRDNATKITSILNKLRQPNGQPWTTKGMRGGAKVWMDLLTRALAGEPEVGITTAWEWSCPECGKIAKNTNTPYPKALVGMHHFPAEPDPVKRKAGQMYSPEVKCAVNAAHGYSRCRITIARFLSLEELKK